MHAEDRVMWPFRRVTSPPTRAPLPFAPVVPAWSEDAITRMSQALRRLGQDDSPGWRKQALIALNALCSDEVARVVARAIERQLNPGHDPERPVSIGHYMHGHPHWWVWLEHAGPAVEAFATAFQQAPSPTTPDHAREGG